MVEVEEILGNTEQAAYYRNLTSSLQAGFHSKWFNETGSPHYCTNSQACNALALDLGAVPEEYQASVLKNLIDSLESHNWHVTVGEVGLPSMTQFSYITKSSASWNLTGVGYDQVCTRF